MAIGFEKALGVHEQALALRAKRTELLANNLANADTPNFKARDFDFTSELKAASSIQGSGSMTLTNAGHMTGVENALSGESSLLYRVPTQPSLDGNTVDLELERAQFSENTVHYQASLQFIERRFKSLLSAFRGE